MPETNEGERNASTISQNKNRFSDIINSLIALSKLGLILVVASFVSWHWSYFSEWATTINHAEIFGIKVDREEAEKHISAFQADTPEFDQDVFYAALKEADLLAPAIQGARIIWIDSNIENNKDERELLQQIGIQIQVLWSTNQLINYLDHVDAAPDLIISNMIRPSDDNPNTPLVKCRAAYVDFPTDKLSSDFNNDIWKFNAQNQKPPPAGLSMAEILATKYPQKFGDNQRQRIIFYTSSSGGRLFSSCSQMITNRPDVLLEHVVTTLGAERSKNLKNFTLVNSKQPCRPNETTNCAKK